MMIISLYTSVTCTHAIYVFLINNALVSPSTGYFSMSTHPGTSSLLKKPRGKAWCLMIGDMNEWKMIKTLNV